MKGNIAAIVLVVLGVFFLLTIWGSLASACENCCECGGHWR